MEMTLQLAQTSLALPFYYSHNPSLTPPPPVLYYSEQDWVNVGQAASIHLSKRSDDARTIWPRVRSPEAHGFPLLSFHLTPISLVPATPDAYLNLPPPVFQTKSPPMLLDIYPYTCTTHLINQTQPHKLLVKMSIVQHIEIERQKASERQSFLFGLIPEAVEASDAWAGPRMSHTSTQSKGARVENSGTW